MLHTEILLHITHFIDQISDPSNMYSNYHTINFIFCDIYGSRGELLGLVFGKDY
jgi:hypothetical protein